MECVAAAITRDGAVIWGEGRKWWGGGKEGAISSGRRNLSQIAEYSEFFLSCSSTLIDKGRSRCSSEKGTRKSPELESTPSWKFRLDSLGSRWKLR
jgi:hypothetical protein